MKSLKPIVPLLFFLVVLNLKLISQIKIVDDDYQPELGKLEELKLEDLTPDLNFDFTVGDSVYVLESTHKFLCFNKRTQKASVKPFKTGFYTITSVSFGDSIHRIHQMVDQYDFDKEYERQEAHAIIYGMKIANKWAETNLNRISRCKKRDIMERCIDWELKEGFPLCGDTCGSSKLSRADLSKLLVSFYQNDISKAFLKKMRDWTPESSDKGFIIGLLYGFENDKGEVFYIDSREIAIKGGPTNQFSLICSYDYSSKSAFNTYVSPRPSEFGLLCNACQIVVLKVSEYSRIRKDLVGKDFYFFDSDILGDYQEEIKLSDYISQKEVKIKRAYGRMLKDAKFDRLKGNSYDESIDLGGRNNLYHCKDLFLRKGKFVVVFKNELGEFSSLLYERKQDNYCSEQNWNSQYYCDRIDFVSKELIDRRVQEKLDSDRLSEVERQKRTIEKQKKAQQAELERIAKQKKHETDILAKYGEKYGNMILQHKVAIGMNKEMCREAGWYPRDTFKTTTSKGVSEIWVINYKTRLYFADGILYMIEN